VSSPLRRDAILDAASYDAPHHGVEIALGDLWVAALQLDRVGRLDDFFELGGDSVAAAALFTGIHETFGIELPTATLLEAPTIAQLAELMERRTGTRETPYRQTTLVLARPARGGSDPLVLVPPREIRQVVFRNLGSALTYRGPIFLLDHPPLKRMDKLAQQHLQGLVSAGLGPRMHLFGVCWGSLLALEMARRAPDYGLRPGVIAVLDPPALLTAAHRLRSRLRNSSPLAAAAVSRFGLYRDEFGSLPWRQRPAWVMRKLRTLAARCASASRNEDLEAEFRQLLPDHPLTTAALTYSPRPPRGPVHLILTRDLPDGSSRRSRRAWGRFLDAAERTHVIAGENWYDIVHGRATELAKVVDRLLAAEDARASAPVAYTRLT
jgi:acyl carrier protein